MTLERIGDYELLEYLTAGGMADLYLARGPRHDGPVVLKTIQRRYVEMTRVVRMFVDEGRIAKALDHPNIVRIYDVGASQGSYYIAMEFIGGRDLLAIARRGLEAGRFLPLHITAAILAQVATGLTYAHEKVDDAGEPLRIVHCDVSPGNVVVSFGGTAKIVDFGIARAAIQLRAEDHTVAGKYNYMAPEQILGKPLDARADLFSLGVILYELTVGRRLFRGRPDDVKSRILGGKIPRPRDVKPELSVELERIILHALEVDRDKRYASARELRHDLLAFVAADGHPAGKREIAEYLREIFVPSTLRPATIGDEPSERGEAFADDEELSLDAPIPGLADLVVDADDPEPGPPPATPMVAELETMPTAEQGVVEPKAPEPVQPAPPPAPVVVREAETHPVASRTEILVAAIAVIVAALLYAVFRN